MSTRFLVIVTILLVACRDSHVQFVDPASVPACLITLPGASSVSANTQGDTSVWLGYSVRAVYPAPEVVHLFSDRLSQSGWVPSRNVFDSAPPQPRPLELQWWYYSQDHPSATVKQLTLSWHNSVGDVVSYELTYTSPNQKIRGVVRHENDLLNIRAGYLPAPLAKAMAAESKRLKPEGP